MNPFEKIFDLFNVKYFLKNYAQLNPNGGIRHRITGKGTNTKDKKLGLTEEDNKAIINGLKIVANELGNIISNKEIDKLYEPSTMNQPKVGIIMGSKSDLNVMQDAADVLKELGVAYEITVVSAHRTPERMFSYAKSAADRGLKVIIAGAGGAAHLPGMVASLTHLPVIGVPVKSSNSIDGWDSILSILQMPNGIPVATVALNAAKNAGILAAQILSTGDETIVKDLIAYKENLKQKVEESAKEMEKGN
ncbi:MAG TPA: 5-(carboxyamino)imidazole ribonucleotide mutase [Mucilaginibacter sp.]|nr:5-(carboxyamino)imidazole ribonucleotide mutase [Mucilaginibacter sp.]